MTVQKARVFLTSIFKFKVLYILRNKTEKHAHFQDLRNVASYGIGQRNPEGI